MSFHSKRTLNNSAKINDDSQNSLLKTFKSVSIDMGHDIISKSANSNWKNSFNEETFESTKSWKEFYLSKESPRKPKNANIKNN